MTIGSGASGGIFSPSLYLGVTIGGVWAMVIIIRKVMVAAVIVTVVIVIIIIIT